MLIFRSLLLVLFSFMSPAMDLPHEAAQQEYLVDREVHILAIALPAALISWENFNKFVKLSGQVGQQMALLIDHFGFDFLNKNKHKVNKCCVAKILIDKDGVIDFERVRKITFNQSVYDMDLDRSNWQKEAIVFGYFKIYSKSVKGPQLIDIFGYKNDLTRYTFIKFILNNAALLEEVFKDIEARGLMAARTYPSNEKIFRQLEIFCNEDHEDYRALNLEFRFSLAKKDITSSEVFAISRSSLEECWKNNDSEIVRLLREAIEVIPIQSYHESFIIKDELYFEDLLISELNKVNRQLSATDEITSSVDPTSDQQILQLTCPRKFDPNGSRI